MRTANMQTLNWNDLRYILAVGRGRTLAAAARLLGVDDTTVARRIAAIQQSIGAQLVQRTGDGTLQLTPTGERAALHAENMETEVASLTATLSGSDRAVSGTVRVTSVPIVINRILVPAAKSILLHHPDLELELIADARDLSLTRRETDIAVRLARPKTGGLKVITRRIGALEYGEYASADVSAGEVKKLPWITYDDAMAHLPQARSIAAMAAGGDNTIAALRVNDTEGVYEAVLAGLGRSLLPCLIADGDPRLRRFGIKRSPPVLTRGLWLLTHTDLKSLGRIQAVMKWIELIVPT